MNRRVEKTFHRGFHAGRRKLPPRLEKPERGIPRVEFSTARRPYISYTKQRISLLLIIASGNVDRVLTRFEELVCGGYISTPPILGGFLEAI